jgi:CoA:oxalate CoA-transferase
MNDRRPLAGCRVLDLSRVVSGPYAGRILADLGADVVKVEPPDGDLTDMAGVRKDGRSGYFAQMNAGKRNVGVDLQCPGAVELVRNLIAATDVLIENFRPSVLARFGLDWPSLRLVNPRLVMLSISGFGATSAFSERRAYAPVVHAESGLLARHAQLDGRAPSDIPMALGDTLAALHGTIAVLAALRLRDSSGLGQHIDLSMMDAMVASDDYTHFAVDGQFEPYPTQGSVWTTVAGPILVAGNAKHVWAVLSQRFELSVPTPREGTDLAAKVSSRHQAICDWFSGFANRAELIAALDGAELAWADVTDPALVLASPAFVGRPIVITPAGPFGRPVVRMPYRFSDATSDPRSGAPPLGHDNSDVLSDWLNADEAAIELLRRQGALISADPRPA